MAGLLTISAAQIERVISAAEAADAIAEDLGRFDVDADPARTAVPLHAGELLVMPCERPDFGGVKLATVSTTGASRIGGVYLLWDTPALAPVALIDGPALTAVRTAALSLVATRLLADPGARRAVVFGTGPQGWAHAQAMAALPAMEWIGVVGRRPGSAAAMAERLASRGVPAEAVGPDAVADAGVICTATTSATPVFEGRLVPDGAHVNAIGTHTPAGRELDAATVSRAAVIAVDTSAAWAAAGEMAEVAGAAAQLRLTLRQLVLGQGRGSPAQGLTVFKSVGAAYADLAVAAAAYRRVASQPGGHEEVPQ